MKKKRILAWIAIGILLTLYLMNLILALIGNESARSMLAASSMCTVLIPILLYGVVVAAGHRKHKDEIVPDEDTDK